jgi:ubiquinone/menaquinone biosynthesis C-methylase UbiE
LKNNKETVESKVISEIPLRDKRVLEIGCGEGRLTTIIAKGAGWLVAVDPDRKSLRKAKKTNPIINGEYKVGKAERLKFPTESFDVIIFTYSLHHSSSKKAIEEAMRVLKDTGEMFIIEPTDCGEIQQIHNLFDDEHSERQQALDLVNSDALSVTKSEIFRSQYIFPDLGDVYDYFYNYYNRKRNDGLTAMIKSIVGSKTPTDHIVLSEDNIIYYCKKLG